MKVFIILFCLLFSAPSFAVSVYVNPASSSQKSLKKVARDSRSYLISQGKRPQSKIEFVKQKDKADIVIPKVSDLLVSWSQNTKTSFALKADSADYATRLAEYFQSQKTQTVVVVSRDKLAQNDFAKAFHAKKVGLQFVVVPKYQNMASKLIPVLSEERQDHGTGSTAILWLDHKYPQDLALISRNLKLYQKFNWYVFSQLQPKPVRDPLLSQVYKTVSLTWLSPQKWQSTQAKRWFNRKGYSYSNAKQINQILWAEFFVWLQSNSDKFYQDLNIRDLHNQKFKSLTGGLEWSKKGLRRASKLLGFHFKKVGKRGYWKSQSI